MPAIDIVDFGGDYAETYNGVCSCGHVTQVSAQKNDAPEYMVTFFVRCVCGESVEMCIPK